MVVLSVGMKLPAATPRTSSSNRETKPPWPVFRWPFTYIGISELVDYFLEVSGEKTPMQEKVISRHIVL
jgi:hypothetical protein